MADKKDEIQKQKEAAAAQETKADEGGLGLEDENIWGDVDDPLKELEGMTDEQIQAAIKEMESQIRREKNDFTNINKQTMDLERRLKENREKLKLNT